MQQAVEPMPAPKKLQKALIIALVFMLLAFGVAAVVSYVKSKGFSEPALSIAGDKAYLLFITIGVVFFLRWLAADAPFSFLRRYTVAPLIKTVISLLIYFGAAFFLLHRLLGINLAPLLTTSAVLTGILVLSMQETIKNLFTGLWINMDRIVAKDDWVRIGDKEGRIMEVTWRTTRILTRDNDYVYFPNRMLAEGVIENYTFPSPVHVLELSVSASYKDPPNRVAELLYELAASTESVLKEPRPIVWLENFGDFSLHYRFRVCIPDYRDIYDVRSELNRKIWYAFRRHNVEIPLPARAIYHHKPISLHVSSEETKASLKGIDFLKVLSEGSMNEVAALAKIEVFGEGEPIVRQGDVGTTCYFIQSGSADVLFRDSGGREVFIANIKAGEFFGEMSLFTGEPRKATVVAKEDAVCVVLDSSAFRKIFMDNPGMAEKLSETLARRSGEFKDALTRTASMAEAEADAQKNILLKIRRFFNIGG